MLEAESHLMIVCEVIEAPPADVPVLPSQCRYKVRDVTTGEIWEDMLPLMGRQVYRDEFKVYPQRVGVPCVIFRVPLENGEFLSHLWIFDEKIVFPRCTCGARKA